MSTRLSEPSAGVPELRLMRRHTVELTTSAYSAIDYADGLFDGRECGGGLFGTVAPEGIRVDGACGAGPDAIRQHSRRIHDGKLARGQPGRQLAGSLSPSDGHCGSDPAYDSFRVEPPAPFGAAPEGETS